MTPCTFCGGSHSRPDPLCLGAAHTARDEGMLRAELGSDEEWREQAFAALTRYLRENETMHVDDLAPHLPAGSGDRRALGPVFVRAARAGLMSKTTTYRPSVASNLSPKPVWRSNICDECAGAARATERG